MLHVSLQTQGKNQADNTPAQQKNYSCGKEEVPIAYHYLLG